MNVLEMLHELAQVLVDEGIPVRMDIEATLNSNGLFLEYYDV